MPEPRQPQQKWVDLGLRTLSAAFLIPAVLAAVWFGGIWFNLLVALIAVLIAQEWTVLVHRRDQIQFALHAGAGVSGALLPPEAGLAAASVAIGIAWLLSISLAHVLNATRNVWLYLGVPYAGVPAMALVVLRGDPQYGTLAILWILAIVWSADSLAYFAGRAIGGPKLAPSISPKKTWAGFFGAIAGSMAASALVAAMAGLASIAVISALAALLAIVAQLGDLFKSALKRHHGVKDSGNLIPGHGGIIDRVDGLLAVAIAAAALGLLRGGMETTGGGLLLW